MAFECTGMSLALEVEASFQSQAQFFFWVRNIHHCCQVKVNTER